jgi:hypothetical protein
MIEDHELIVLGLTLYFTIFYASLLTSRHMKNKKLFFPLLFIYFLSSQSSIAQISRGASAGEIYLNLYDCYIDSIGAWHWGLFHSYDHGQHLSLQYSSTINHFNTIGDPTPGKVYGCKGDTIWMSTDYGVTWNTYLTNIIDTFGLSAGGNAPGEIYLEDNQFKIFSS